MVYRLADIFCAEYFALVKACLHEAVIYVVGPYKADIVAYFGYLSAENLVELIFPVAQLHHAGGYDYLHAVAEI